MDGKIIERKKEAVNLGITFDEVLSWTKYVNISVSSAYRRLNQCYRHKKFLTMQTKINICESYVLSNFNYSDVLLQNMN